MLTVIGILLVIIGGVVGGLFNLNYMRKQTPKYLYSGMDSGIDFIYGGIF